MSKTKGFYAAPKVLFLMLCVAVSNTQADDGVLVYYDDTEPKQTGFGRSKANPPGPEDDVNPWTEAPAAGVPIPGGGTMYFAFPNGHQWEWKKTLTVRVIGHKKVKIPSTWAGRRTRGHYGTKGKVGGGSAPAKPLSNPDGWEYTLTYDPQPEWEWIEVKNSSGGPVTVKVEADPDCDFTGQDRCRGSSSLIHQGLFGTAGKMIGDMWITEIQMFPESIPVNVADPLWFVGPPGSGNWTSEFVYDDPDGDPRPQGGVRFTTDGPGFEAGQIYSLGFGMTGTVDLLYSLYAFESDSAEYRAFPLDIFPRAKEWRTVRTHSGVGTLSIDLDELASGNGDEGPIVESRLGGILEVEIDFGRPVVLLDGTAVTVTDWSQLYIPDSVGLINGGQTLEITFAPGALPDQNCYSIDIQDAIENIAGYTSCRIRALVGDVDGDGEVTTADVTLIQGMVGDPLDASNAWADVDLDGSITSSDTLVVESNLGHAVLCREIPTVSEWGLIVMLLLVLTAGTFVLIRRRPASVERSS